MPRITHTLARAVALAAVACFLVLASCTAALAAPTAQSAAARAKSARAQLSNEVVRAVNRERAKRGLRALRNQGKLVRAARSHSVRMARTDVFSHFLGGRPSARVARVGYLAGSHSWAVGENLAWIPAHQGGRDVVRAWLRSPAHRRVMLSRTYREIGVGVSAGAPLRGRRGGYTVTAEFAARN